MNDYLPLLLIMTPALFVLCAYDYKIRRLPNILLAIMLGGVLLFRFFFMGGGVSLLSSLLGGVCAGTFLLIPFLMRTAGAGDVKLLFVIGLMMGIHHVMLYLTVLSLLSLLQVCGILFFMYFKRPYLRHAMRCFFDVRYDRVEGRQALPIVNRDRYRMPFACTLSVSVWGTYGVALWLY